MAVSDRAIDRSHRLRQGLRWLFFSALAGVVGLVGYAFYGQIAFVLALHHEQADLRTELDAVHTRNAALEARLLLADDPEYLAYLVRRDLGLVMPGEVKYILPPGTP